MENDGTAATAIPHQVVINRTSGHALAFAGQVRLAGETMQRVCRGGAARKAFLVADAGSVRVAAVRTLGRAN